MCNLHCLKRSSARVCNEGQTLALSELGNARIVQVVRVETLCVPGTLRCGCGPIAAVLLLSKRVCVPDNSHWLQLHAAATVQTACHKLSATVQADVGHDTCVTHGVQAPPVWHMRAATCCHDGR
jgi:hypothetical protein